MKNRMAVFLGIISLLLVLALIGMAYLMLHHPQKIAPLNKMLEKAPQQHELVVLDFDNNGLLDEAELMQGHDGVITVNNPKKGIDEPFNSVSALQRLDTNKDGRIDEKDSSYPYMDLMFFTENGKGRRYMSFKQAGIKYIKFDQKRLEKPNMTLNPKDNIIGKAGFADGKEHTIRLIMISVR